MPKRTGSPFLKQPTVVILPGAAKSLGEFKFQSREAWPNEYVYSIEGFVEDDWVYIEEFVDNLEFSQGGAINKGSWLEIPEASITKAKQSAAAKRATTQSSGRRMWLGTIHSHPYKGARSKDDVNPSLTDHIDGHFQAETISAIYSVSKNKNGKLYSLPLHFFVPQGRIKVVGP